MSEEIKRCLRCEGQLQLGFVVDAFWGENHVQQARWQPGEPQKSYWTGSLKNESHLRKRITAHRCENCGAIELFA